MSSLGYAKSNLDIINKYNPERVTELAEYDSKTGKTKYKKLKETIYFCKRNNTLKLISYNLYVYKTGGFYIAKSSTDIFTIDENDLTLIKNTFILE